MNRISAVAVSEVSVTSPYRPPRSAPIPVRNNGTNSDYPLAPRRVRYAASTPARPVTQPRPERQPAAAEPKPSGIKRFALLTGALMASLGTLAGLVSIAVLGPLGLGVAAAAAAIGTALIYAGSKLK